MLPSKSKSLSGSSCYSVLDDTLHWLWGTPKTHLTKVRCVSNQLRFRHTFCSKKMNATWLARGEYPLDSQNHLPGGK